MGGFVLHWHCPLGGDGARRARSRGRRGPRGDRWRGLAAGVARARLMLSATDPGQSGLKASRAPAFFVRGPDGDQQLVRDPGRQPRERLRGGFRLRAIRHRALRRSRRRSSPRHAVERRGFGGVGRAVKDGDPLAPDQQPFGRGRHRRRLEPAAAVAGVASASARRAIASHSAATGWPGRDGRCAPTSSQRQRREASGGQRAERVERQRSPRRRRRSTSLARPLEAGEIRERRSALVTGAAPRASRASRRPMKRSDGVARRVVGDVAATSSANASAPSQRASARELRLQRLDDARPVHVLRRRGSARRRWRAHRRDQRPPRPAGRRRHRRRAPGDVASRPS